MPKKKTEPVPNYGDRLHGTEQEILDTLFAITWPLAKQGDGESIDRTLRILAMKRQYRQDRQAEEI